jgi:hypothetical protein
VTAIVTLVLLVLLFIAVYSVFDRLDSDPKAILGTDGTVITQRDSYARAKDFFVIVFPLFSAVATFWLGAAIEGKRADQSEADAKEKGKEAAKSQDQLKAVLDSSQSGVLTAAKAAFPDAFK